MIDSDDVDADDERLQEMAKSHFLVIKFFAKFFCTIIAYHMVVIKVL